MEGNEPSNNSPTFHRTNGPAVAIQDIITGSLLSGNPGMDSVSVAGVISPNQTFGIATYNSTSSPAQYHYNGVLGLGKSSNIGMLQPLLNLRQ